MKIGIISDTHGILPEEVMDLFSGVDAILHAGDIGSLQVVKELEAIAPVHAVAGNMDGGEVARRFPRTDMIELGGVFFYLVHEPFRIDIDPGAAGVRAVVFGHTHIPHVEDRDGVVFLNPGSAVHPGFGRRPSVIVCKMIDHDRLKAEIVHF